MTPHCNFQLYTPSCACYVHRNVATSCVCLFQECFWLQSSTLTSNRFTLFGNSSLILREKNCVPQSLIFPLLLREKTVPGLCETHLPPPLYKREKLCTSTQNVFLYKGEKLCTPTQNAPLYKGGKLCTPLHNVSLYKGEKLCTPTQNHVNKAFVHF